MYKLQSIYHFPGLDDGPSWLTFHWGISWIFRGREGGWFLVIAESMGHLMFQFKNWHLTEN